MIVTIPAEELEEAKKHAKILDAFHPDGEKSQILSILIA